MPGRPSGTDVTQADQWECEIGASCRLWKRDAMGGRDGNFLF